MMNKKSETVCIDFDWTLCSTDEFDEPNSDVVSFIKLLKDKGYRIIVYTSRKNSELSTIREWLVKYDLSDLIFFIIGGKPEAVVYLDDRSIRYGGRDMPDLPSPLLEDLIDYIVLESERLL